MADAPDDLDARLEALYAGPPGDFVAGRREVVREFGAGDPATGRNLAGLRRPTLTAWIVNRLRATHRDDFEGLLESGRALRRAVVAGDPSPALDRRRRAVDLCLRRAGEEWLGTQGRAMTLAQVRRVAGTLEALSIGSDAEEVTEARAGRLAADLEPPGLDALIGLTPGRRPEGPAARSGRPPERGGGDGAARRRSRAGVRRKVTRLERKLEQSERQAERVRAEVLELQERLDEARQRRVAARAAMEALQAELRSARRELADLEDE